MLESEVAAASIRAEEKKSDEKRNCQLLLELCRGYVAAVFGNTFFILFVQKQTTVVY